MPLKKDLPDLFDVLALPEPICPFHFGVDLEEQSLVTLTTLFLEHLPGLAPPSISHECFVKAFE